MWNTKFNTIAAIGFVATTAFSCGQISGDTSGATTSAERDQAVTVIPEFSVAGTSAMPQGVFVSHMGLVISEIRLEPLPVDSAQTGGVAYSTASPTRLEFDVAGGETTKLARPVELPQSGRYLVSVRLEPVTELAQSEAGLSEQVRSSFSVAGYVAGDSIVRVDPRTDGQYSDGSPVPMPFDEHDRVDEGELDDTPALPTGWTAFHYDSQRSVYFTLNKVNLEPGKQYLSFEFDVRDWAREAVDSLVDAVEHTGQLNPASRSRGIDVTTPLESSGHGAETLFESAEVRSARHRGR